MKYLRRFGDQIRSVNEEAAAANAAAEAAAKKNIVMSNKKKLKMQPVNDVIDQPYLAQMRKFLNFWGTNDARINLIGQELAYIPIWPGTNYHNKYFDQILQRLQRGEYAPGYKAPSPGLVAMKGYFRYIWNELQKTPDVVLTDDNVRKYMNVPGGVQR